MSAAQVTGQPQNSVPISAGQSASIRVYASGSNITYQWYYNNPGDTSQPLNGATSSILTTAASATYLYWVRITGQCGSIDSTSAYISVLPTITSQPQSVSIGSGSTTTLTVNATGRLLHYTWRYWPSGNVIPGSPDAPAYMTGAITADTNIYCNVMSGTAPVNSDIATISMCNGVTFGSIYVYNSGGCNRNVSIPISGGYPDSYAWYQGTRGDTSHLMTTYSTMNICITGPTTYWVRAGVTDPDTGVVCYSDSPAFTVQ